MASPPEDSMPKAVGEWLRAGWGVAETLTYAREGNVVTVTATWKGETRSQRFIEVDGTLQIEETKPA